jgi:aryl sulfotransferase
MRTHAANMKEGWLDFMYTDDIHESFRRFTDFPKTSAGTDDLTLASIVAHYRSFKTWAHLPNIHFFHYADMTRDRLGQITRLAALLNLDHPPELLAAIADATSFSVMKSIEELMAVNDSVFQNYGKFFDSATSNKWEGKLTAEDIDRYNNRIHQLLPENQRNWLDWGTSGNPNQK